MGMGVYRTRIFSRGLANCFVREREPSDATVLTNIGLIKEVTTVDTTEDVDVIGDNGLQLNSLEVKNQCGAKITLHQTAKSELDFIRSCRGKVYAVQYFGFLTEQLREFQYWCWELSKLRSPNDLKFDNTPRTIALNVVGLHNEDAGYDIPVYHTVQVDRELAIQYMRLFLPIYDGKNTGTAQVLDVSGFARHGTLNSDFASIWQTGTTPENFLRFDGSNDYLSLGNILNDDGASDFMVECWTRIKGADSGQEEILAKKSLTSNHSAGFSLYRSSGNKIIFKISDSAASASVTSSNNVLQDIWKHVAIAVDRNGNGQLYINGAADGSASAVSAVGSASNALDYLLGSDNTNSGQVDIGMVRHHIYGAGGLPSNIATIISNHYEAERSKFGL